MVSQPILLLLFGRYVQFLPQLGEHSGGSLGQFLAEGGYVALPRLIGDILGHRWVLRCISGLMSEMR